MIIGFLLLYLFLYCKYFRDYGKTLVYTCLIYVLGIFLFNEVLSLFNAIFFLSILGYWICWDVILIVLCYRNRFDIKINISKKVYLGIFLVFFILVIIISLNIIPYNWDSLSYHMPRIYMWLNNKSVAHFSTNDTRMLGTPPLYEFVGLHVYSLCGDLNDSLLNLIQTFSYIISILLVIYISKLIGYKNSTSLLAGFLFASVPIAIAEAFSTQTDEFSTVFSLCFVALIINESNNIEKIDISVNSIYKILFLGLSIGFVWLSKPSGMFPIFFFSLFLLYHAIKNKVKTRAILFWIVFTILIMIVIISPETIRNYITYEAFMDPWQGVGQLVLSFDPRMLIVNLLKNIGTNLSFDIFPNFLSLYVNFVYSLGNLLGINVDSPIISEGGQAYSLHSGISYNFDAAPCLVFFIIVIFLLFVKLIRIVTKKDKATSIGITIVVSFISMLAFVKWEPYMVRYLLAVFPIMSIWVAKTLENLMIDNFSINKLIYKSVIVTSGIVLFGGLLYFTIGIFQYHGEERSLKYYRSNPIEYEMNYKSLENALKEIYGDDVGYDMYSSGCFHYPIMRLLSEHFNNIEIVNSKNDTIKYEENNTIPEYIVLVSLKGRQPSKDITEYEYKGVEYSIIEKLSDTCYLIKKTK